MKSYQSRMLRYILSGLQKSNYSLSIFYKKTELSSWGDRNFPPLVATSELINLTSNKYARWGVKAIHIFGRPSQFYMLWVLRYFGPYFSCLIKQIFVLVIPDLKPRINIQTVQQSSFAGYLFIYKFIKIC